MLQMVVTFRQMACQDDYTAVLPGDENETRADLTHTAKYD